MPGSCGRVSTSPLPWRTPTGFGPSQPGHRTCVGTRSGGTWKYNTCLARSRAGGGEISPGRASCVGLRGDALDCRCWPGAKCAPTRPSATPLLPGDPDEGGPGELAVPLADADVAVAAAVERRSVGVRKASECTRCPSATKLWPSARRDAKPCGASAGSRDRAPASPTLRAKLRRSSSDGLPGPATPLSPCWAPARRLGTGRAPSGVVVSSPVAGARRLRAQGRVPGCPRWQVVRQRRAGLPAS